MRPNLNDILIARGCPEFEKLHRLRRKGWQDERLDKVFEQQRATADNAGPELSYAWFLRMKKILQEIDEFANVIPCVGPLQFLDLGCCPGGFTSYILSRNRSARGVGVSLQVENGGHGFTLEKQLRKRFDLHYADLTSYHLGPTTIVDDRLQPLPSQVGSGSFDVVLLDGHQLRTYTSEHVTPWDIDCLLISQIIIALQAVKDGGNIIMKLSHPERISVAQLLFLLDVLSTELLSYKPRTMHTNRGSFYAVAKGVGLGVRGSDLLVMIIGLRKLWTELTYGGPDGKGRFIKTEDLDFVVSCEELSDGYLDRLIELGRDVWTVQANRLEEWLVRRDHL